MNKKGEPEDVHVVSAEPAGTFDRAAIAAVRRWRYEPLVIDGRTAGSDDTDDGALHPE